MPTYRLFGGQPEKAAEMSEGGLIGVSEFTVDQVESQGLVVEFAQLVGEGFMQIDAEGRVEILNVGERHVGDGGGGCESIVELDQRIALRLAPQQTVEARSLLELLRLERR